MCGIVAVLGQRSGPPSVTPADALAAVAAAQDRLAAIGGGTFRPVAPWPAGEDVDHLRTATAILSALDRGLRGPSGLRCLLGDPSTVDDLAALTARLGQRIAAIERFLDDDVSGLSAAHQEERNDALVRLKDLWWAVERDRLGMARAVRGLVGDEGLPANLDAWWAIAVALDALERLEVRGRDSAGLHVLVTGHDLDLSSPDMRQLIGRRADDVSFTSGAVRVASGCLSIVYKTAAEIGELGDNVRALRSQVGGDTLLARALSAPEVRVTVLGHTRWASVGPIVEANAHPLDAGELGGPPGPHVVATLNGDVENHSELVFAESLALPPAITTDAKVIPVLISRRLAGGLPMMEAFRSTVARLDGSVAVAAAGSTTPDALHLAVRGSGQSLYVGLADGAFVVTSEPYGLVEETDRYLRVGAGATGGQVVALHREAAGTVGGIERVGYDGSRSPVTADQITTAEITTRDIDRRGFAHYLLKELNEAPSSFRKTLRSRIVTAGDGLLQAYVGQDALPAALVEAVATGTVQRAVVIGQGTAAVAGQAVAAAVSRLLPALAVTAVAASELSGYGLAEDMADTVVVAISQSGTTTDTNRAVDLARARGAHVVAIVNRRNSDLATKAHGVLYTSDGRDVEMSVPSTKAFYAQIAAGWLLAAALAEAAGSDTTPARQHRHRVLSALRTVPPAMEEVLGHRDAIGRIARRIALRRRHWAVVGSGADRVAAAEVRIKLSELCYRSVATDTVEDKKHIDLSSEPLVLVCAAGLHGPTADDAAKEVAIFQAHRAAPMVITTDREAARFRDVCDDVFTVPEIDTSVAFILSAMAGHLFGYEAALAIDAQARAMRALRVATERILGSVEHDELARLRAGFGPMAREVQQDLASGVFDGTLRGGTAVRLAELLHHAAGVCTLDSREHAWRGLIAPSALLGDLRCALSTAIDELRRPVDAIKHQAKTVTVGTSRSQDDLLSSPLVQAVLAAGASPDRIGSRSLRTLRALDDAVAETFGSARYRIEWLPGRPPTIDVSETSNMACQTVSPTTTSPRLRGTKHWVADEREVLVTCSAGEEPAAVLVPEVADGQVVGMTLLHVRLHPTLPAQVAAQLLRQYRNRYAALAHAVMELDRSFDERRLGEQPVVDLLTRPVPTLAERWRRAS